MNRAILIPKIIKAGFQARQNTYTGKLSYIIYFDNKNKLRKEASWQSWRNKSIQDMEVDNVPTEGFVLNKKAGGYSSGWNSRQTYVRVYDPRGFEFEITIPNLLYILENTTSTKGKGLEGEFIYGWEGTELILLPVSAPDYKDYREYSDIMFENKTIKAKDLVAGYTYKDKHGDDFVFLGKHQAYESAGGWGGLQSKYKPLTKKFFFGSHGAVITMTAVTSKFVNAVEEISDSYSDLQITLEKSSEYRQATKLVHVPFTEVELNSVKTWIRVYVKDSTNNVTVYVDIKDGEPRFSPSDSTRGYYGRGRHEYTTKEFIEKYNPCKVEIYLSNGKLFKTEGQLNG